MSGFTGYEILGGVVQGASGGAVGSSLVTTTGSPTARSLASRFASPINVLDYGAVGNGSTDDTAALVAAFAALPSGGGAIYLPGGHNFMCNANSLVLPSSCAIYGDGKGSILTCNTSGTGNFLIDTSGATASTQSLFQDIRDIHLEGGSYTGPAIRSIYTQAMNLDRIYAHQFVGGFLNSAQLFDCRFNDLHLLSCGGSSSSVVMSILNSVASSGFGFSSGNANQVFLRGVHIEQFLGIGLLIGRGTNNTNAPNGIYVSQFKAESLFCTNQPFISVGAGTTNCAFRDIYLAFDSFNSGSSTPFVGFMNAGSGGNYFNNINYGMGSGLLSNGFQQASTQPDTIDTIYWGTGNNPSTAVLNITAGAQPIILNGVVSFAGITPLIVGGPTAPPASGEYLAGTFIRNMTPAEAGTTGSKFVVIGWLCTASGNPGTWLACRALTGD